MQLKKQKMLIGKLENFVSSSNRFKVSLKFHCTSELISCIASIHGCSVMKLYTPYMGIKTED